MAFSPRQLDDQSPGGGDDTRRAITKATSPPIAKPTPMGVSHPPVGSPSVAATAAFGVPVGGALAVFGTGVLTGTITISVTSSGVAVSAGALVGLGLAVAAAGRVGVLGAVG